LCEGLGNNTWNFVNGLGGESSSQTTPPDNIAIIPTYRRQVINWANGNNEGAVTFDYPFYGTLTNTPYTVQSGGGGSFIDTTIAIALKPTSQPTWPSAAAATPLWAFP
jgi:hypothetical protein